jgi:hypothetical protein
MKRSGYTSRSIEIPDWMNAVLVDIAGNHKRSVNAEIQCVIESWLEGVAAEADGVEEGEWERTTPL